MSDESGGTILTIAVLGAAAAGVYYLYTHQSLLAPAPAEPPSATVPAPKPGESGHYRVTGTYLEYQSWLATQAAQAVSPSYAVLFGPVGATVGSIANVIPTLFPPPYPTREMPNPGRRRPYPAPVYQPSGTLRMQELTALLHFNESMAWEFLEWYDGFQAAGRPPYETEWESKIRAIGSTRGWTEED